MTVTRRQFVNGCVATATLQGIDGVWPRRSIASAERDGFRWVNKHQNVAATPWRHYDVWNHGAGGRCGGMEACRGGFDSLRGILDDAQARRRRVRAVGRRWSLSPVAVCPDIMINTMPLNYHLVGLPASDVSTSSVDPSHLVFAQCGTSVLELSLALEPGACHCRPPAPAMARRFAARLPLVHTARPVVSGRCRTTSLGSICWPTMAVTTGLSAPRDPS
jgi:hypothetical protein